MNCKIPKKSKKVDLIDQKKESACLAAGKLKLSSQIKEKNNEVDLWELWDIFK